MKLFWTVFFAGLILFYFVANALKIKIDSLEMFLHMLYHFFAGAIILAGWYFYKSKRRLKIFLLSIFAILFIDELGDYFRGVEDMTSMMLAFNLYMLFWGAVSGIVLIRYWRRRHIADK